MSRARRSTSAIQLIRTRLTYANVMATLAMFMALGGVAFAAATVGSQQIINNSILSRDVKNGTLTGSDVATGSITGAQVASDSLTGSDIDEATLGSVPTAANAGTLDGVDSTGFLGTTAKAADSDMLDGLNSTAFLGVGAKAADADLLDGLNSTAFLGSSAKAADADLLDGLNSTAFLGAGAQAADSALFGGNGLSTFVKSGDAPASGALTGTYPNPTLATGSVGTGAVSNGSLFAEDTAWTVGSSAVDLGNVTAQGCQLGTIAVAGSYPAGEYVIDLYPPLNFASTTLVVKSYLDPTFPPTPYGFYVCNIGTVDVDPPAGSWKYMIHRLS